MAADFALQNTTYRIGPKYGNSDRNLSRCPRNLWGVSEHEETELETYVDELYEFEEAENASPITNIVLQIEIMGALGRWWK